VSTMDPDSDLAKRGYQHLQRLLQGTDNDASSHDPAVVAAAIHRYAESNTTRNRQLRAFEQLLRERAEEMIGQSLPKTDLSN
jgi:hypothetical protein